MMCMEVTEEDMEMQKEIVLKESDGKSNRSTTVWV